MKETLVLLADPVYGWEVEKAYIWQDDAACAFQPPSLFEIASEGDPVSEGLSVNESKDLTTANLAAAQKICNGCPVWDRCYTSADPEDFETTMRAGIMPTLYNPQPSGKPRKNKKDLTKPCPEGHVDWQTRSDGRGHRCGPCHSEAQRVARASKPQKVRRKSPSVVRGIKCNKGLHDDWLKKPGKTVRGHGVRGTWECLPCKRERDAANARKRRGKVEG